MNKVELIKKIKALAERGVGGEQQNAKEILDRLMATYEMTESDLDDTVELHTFPYHDSVERSLLAQIIYMVTCEDASCIVGAYSNRPRKSLGATCTEADAELIATAYEFYKDVLEGELKVFLRAFYVRNNIFPPSSKVAPKEESELTPEELERQKRAMIMSMTMDIHSMNSSLPPPDKNR